MKYRTNIFVSVILLIVYGTLTFVAVPFHYHDDPLFIGGSGHQTIAQHDDALHCKHHTIEIHSDCTICNFVSNSAATKVVAFIPDLNPKSPERVSPISSTIIQDVHSSHSRRGPPSIFA